MFANNFLSDDEISKLCETCKQFGVKHPVHLGENITRIIHLVICTVPWFVEEHKTLRLFSDKSSENLHAVVMMDMPQLVSVKNEAEKLRLAFVRQELGAATDRSMIFPKHTRWHEAVLSTHRKRWK